MKFEIVRTISEKVKNEETSSAFRAMALAVKNLQNSTRFVIRQVISAYSENTLKKDLHPEQLKALQLAENACAFANINRIKTNEKKVKKALEENRKAKTSALLKSFLTGCVGNLASPWQILDISLLDKVMQLYTDQEGKRPYTSLPATVAQQAVAQVRTDFLSWLNALSEYTKSPDKFTGKPKIPSYKPKQSYAVVKIPYAKVHSKLISVKDKELFEDYEKTKPLSKMAQIAYMQFNIKALIGKAIFRCNAPNLSDVKVKEIRLVPKKNAMVVEVVIGWKIELCDDCSLAKALKIQNSDTQSKKKSLSDIGAELLSSLPLGEIPVSAGIDMGLTNLMTVVYTNGQTSTIISNRKFENRVQTFDMRIGRKQAELVSSRMRELQKIEAQENFEREFGPVPLHRRLTHAQFDELRKLKQEVQKDAELLKIQKDREQWISDALHKASAGVVTKLIEQKVKVLVVGHNIGWKDEANMGTKGNRRFLATAHTRLIEHLKYKCFEKGILVIETEESYTSKTSFAKNENLKKYLAESDIDEDRKESLGEISAEGVNLSDDKGKVSRRAGVRHAIKGALNKAKNAFITKGLTGRWSSIHADVNGAFNILRKFYLNFVRHKGLSSSFELWGLSHFGLARLLKTA